jgi:Tol biopolymer transport system component
VARRRVVAMVGLPVARVLLVGLVLLCAVAGCGGGHSARTTRLVDMGTRATRLVTVGPRDRSPYAFWPGAPAVSGDGRFVAFDTQRSMQPGVHGDQLYVRDVAGSTTELVSVSTSGKPGNGQQMGSVQVSNSGRFVLFASDATNLVKGDTNDFEDVFLRDRHTHTTQIVPHVTVDVDGTWAMSGNARYLAFASPGHDNQIGWFDRATGAVKHSTVGNDEVGVYGVSDDGGTVLVNGSFGPRIWKPLIGRFTRIDQGVDGQLANAWVNPDALSADGRYVMFTTPANNIVRGDTNHASDVFVRDLKTGRTERVSVGPHNAQSNRSSSGEALSADGRYRLFKSSASHLITNDTNTKTDIFINDQDTGTTVRCDVSTNDAEANRPTGVGAISANGLYVAFVSEATNLTPRDTNRQADIFERGPHC